MEELLEPGRVKPQEVGYSDSELQVDFLLPPHGNVSGDLPFSIQTYKLATLSVQAKNLCIFEFMFHTTDI